MVLASSRAEELIYRLIPRLSCEKSLTGPCRPPPSLNAVKQRWSNKGQNVELPNTRLVVISPKHTAKV